MPIDNKKLDALQAAIKNALNPPVPVAMTMEEFLKYAGEQLAKLANEDGEIAKNRVLALNAAFETMKAAGEAKLEKADVVVFEEPWPKAPVEPVAAAPIAPVAIAEPVAPVAEVTPPVEPAPAPEIAKAAKFVWPGDMADAKDRAAAFKPADKK
jgi:hypothetical protein